MTKQVIIIRRDLKMRRGKEIAQGSHAAMAFICDRLLHTMQHRSDRSLNLDLLSTAEKEWLMSGHAKIVLQADTEQMLRDIDAAARKQQILSYLVTDKGLTEFHNVPTITALALGPDKSEKIDALTGPQGQFPLKLY